MDKKNNTNLIILVVEDVQETREGIEKLLMVDGYRVALARDEQDGIESARRQRPDLILVSLAGVTPRGDCFRPPYSREGCDRRGCARCCLLRR